MVMPAIGPTGGYPAWFLAHCFGKVCQWLFTISSLSQKVRVCSGNRVSKNGDDFAVGDLALYRLRGPRKVDVRRRGFDDYALVLCRFEELLIVFEASND